MTEIGRLETCKVIQLSLLSQESDNAKVCVTPYVGEDGNDTATITTVNNDTATITTVKVECQITTHETLKAAV